MVVSTDQAHSLEAALTGIAVRRSGRPVRVLAYDPHQPGADFSARWRWIRPLLEGRWLPMVETLDHADFGLRVEQHCARKELCALPGIQVLGLRRRRLLAARRADQIVVDCASAGGRLGATPPSGCTSNVPGRGIAVVRGADDGRSAVLAQHPASSS